MWIASISPSGVYEAESLEALKKSIVELEADNQADSLPIIEDVYKCDSEQSLTEKGLSEFIEACESDFEAELEEIAASKEYQRQVESDYYASVL